MYRYPVPFFEKIVLCFEYSVFPIVEIDNTVLKYEGTFGFLNEKSLPYRGTYLFL
jgi:hypothetical protein